MSLVDDLSNRSDSDDESEPPLLVSVDVESTKTIPVTILTGFLGAGKSTLLNYILTNNRNMRIAVIENEFSAGLGIEGMIVKSGLDGSNIDNFFELSNGCICCTVKDSLVATLEQLAQHKDRFDYILIETTGLADPGKLISIFWMDDAIESALKLDGVVTVVDAKNMDRYLASPDTKSDFTSQVAYADRILINKTDLITPQQLQDVEHFVLTVNGYAEIKHTTFSQTDPSWLLHTDSFNSTVAQAVEQTLRTFDSVFCVPCIPTVHSAQSPTVQSTGIELRGSFDVKKLSTYLDSILYSDAKSVGGEIFRIKGLLHVSSHSNYFLLQAVHDIFDITETEVAVDASLGELVNKIVVIGRGLVIEDLRAGFMSCLAT